MSDETEKRHKRILYRAIHRGFKEADILIGGFARDRMHTLNEAELDAFESLLDQNDHDIYGWVLGNRPVPAEHDTALMRKLNAYALEARPVRT